MYYLILPTHLPCEVDTVGIYILEMRQQRHRKVKQLAQHHKASIQTQTLWPRARETSGIDGSCQPVVSTSCPISCGPVPNLCSRAFKFRSCWNYSSFLWLQRARQCTSLKARGTVFNFFHSQPLPTLTLEPWRWSLWGCYSEENGNGPWGETVGFWFQPSNFRSA